MMDPRSDLCSIRSTDAGQSLELTRQGSNLSVPQGRRPDVRTTMIYPHVLDRPGLGVLSPADMLSG